MALRFLLAILLLLTPAMSIAWGMAALNAGDAGMVVGTPGTCGGVCSCCPVDACPCARPAEPEQRPVAPTPRPQANERWELPSPPVVGRIVFNIDGSSHRHSMPVLAGAYRPVADTRFHAFIGVWLT